MHPEEPWEMAAVEYGGQCGGEFLDEIKKYNFAELTQDEWNKFTTCICMNYHAKYRELEPVPF